MYTQCPKCEVAFRITAEVLQQARGKVRCGNCGEAFNALDHLSESLAPRDGQFATDNNSADSQNSLLDSMKELGGPDDVHIEDTGIEWRLVDENPESSGDVARPQNGSPDDYDAAEVAAAAPDEPRYDDNTPLPDDFGADVARAAQVFTPPTRRASDQLANEVVDDAQTELELGDPDDWASLLDEVTEPPVVAESAVEVIDDGAPVAEPSGVDDSLNADQGNQAGNGDAPSVIDTRIEPDLNADDEGSGFYTNSFHLIQDEDGDILLAEDTDGESLDEDDGKLVEDLELELVDEGVAEADTSNEGALGTDSAGTESSPLTLALSDFGPADDVPVDDVPVDDRASAHSAGDTDDATPETTGDWITEAGRDDEAGLADAAELEAGDSSSDAAAADAEAPGPVVLDDHAEESPDAATSNAVADAHDDLSADRLIDDVETPDNPAASKTGDDGGERFETAIADAEREVEQDDDNDNSAILAMTANMEIDPAVLQAMQDNDASPMVEAIVMEGDFVGANSNLDESANSDDGASADPGSLLDTYISSRDHEGGAPANRVRLGASIGLLLVLLSGQFIHSQRETLATYPLFQQTIAPIYRSIGMPVTPNWDIRGWQFEGVPEGSTDGEESMLTISSQLANRSGQALPYPLVHVSLTDRYEEVVGSRILEPDEYLRNRSDPGRRVPAGESFTATIAIATAASVETATGFKLDVCYRDIPNRVRCAIQDFKRP